MRPLRLWILAIVAFVIPMIVAFYVSMEVRKAQSHAKATMVGQDDPELEVAIETAKRELPGFIKTLANPPKDVISMAVKVRFVKGSHAEAMWVDHLTYANDTFIGTLADQPIVVDGMHKGDKVTAPTKDVVDWLILHQSPTGTLKEGDETGRVLRRRLGANLLRYPPAMPTSTKRLV